MKRKRAGRGLWLWAVLGVAVAIAIGVLALNWPASRPASLVIGKSSYRITAYAYTWAQRETGLMNFSVTNQTLMLFSFGETGIYPFWMKNTYSQLDIIWIDYNYTSGSGNIVYIANATPCIDYDKGQQACTIYTPGAYANYVAEAGAGFVQRNHIVQGERTGFLFNQG